MKLELENDLTAGIENMIKEAINLSLSNSQEKFFVARFARACKKASQRRKELETAGEHIPPFLIAGIGSQCSLHCSGCYARANHTCGDNPQAGDLSAKEWFRIFKEARALGISFILLAGGEPLMRRDVLAEAGKLPDILFPVFTNGMLVNEEYEKFFDTHRNVMPVFSIEGGENTTDKRRGSGVYRKVIKIMERLQEKGIFFGASITVTTQNLKEVVEPLFLNMLSRQGCKAIFFVEYVAAEEGTEELALKDTDRNELNWNLDVLKRHQKDAAMYFTFPGDEKAMGGCLAAGRGFFHINYKGDAQPCPFSPYSDTNIKELPLRQAMKSPLFQKLVDTNVMFHTHSGGCVLFENSDIVEALMQ